MGHAYTPGLKVTERLVVKKQRILPLKGDVLVKVGDKVKPDDVVARTELPGNVVPINVANKLGIPPEDIDMVMLKKVGDPIKEGDIAKTSLFRDGEWFVDIDPDVLSHEITNLMVGREYCFTGTVTTANCCGTKESAHSEPVCRRP